MQILVSCSKGISNDTLETVNEILDRVVPPELRERLAYLSGPSFAAEVAAGQPTAVTIASKHDDVAARVQALMSTPRFRCYRTDDVIGGALHREIWKYCQSTSGVQPQVLQYLRVRSAGCGHSESWFLSVSCL